MQNKFFKHSSSIPEVVNTDSKMASVKIFLLMSIAIFMVSDKISVVKVFCAEKICVKEE